MQATLARLLVVTAIAATQLVCPSSAAPSPQATPPSNASPAPQPPTFRAGTDLITVDVSVIDRNGRPVEGLTPGDFTVKIDGKVRRVVVAELVKAGVTPGAAAASATAGSAATLAGVTPVGVTPAGATPSAAAAAANGRHVLFAVDQLNIAPGSIKPLLLAASNFLNQLMPRDQVGYIAFPTPGPRVDFTTDKERVREALKQSVGLTSIQNTALFDISLVEARAIMDRERYQVHREADEIVRENPAPDAADTTPVLHDLMARNCPPDASADERNECRRRIVNESAAIAQRSRADAKISVRTLESIVEQLGAIEGSKSLILISSSMAIDDQHDLDELIRIAAATRTSFNVLIVDPWKADVKVAPNMHGQAPTENDERRLRAEGLEELAADGRGAVYRVAGNSEGLFDRLALELSASYVLGVESTADDLKPDSLKVDVQIRHQGARIRTSQAFVPSALSLLSRRLPDERPRSPESVLRDLLSDRSEVGEVPLRLSTFNQWDAGSSKVRVNLAASFGAPGAPPGDFVVGYEVTDGQKRTVASSAQKRTTADATGANAFGAVMLLDPGAYSLHLSVVNAEGKRATIIRDITATRSSADKPATSDLLVGDPPGLGRTLAPVAESRVSSTRVAAYFELYADRPDEFDWTFVRLEVARDVDAPALASDEADVRTGQLLSWRIVTGEVDMSSLPAGSYLLRARITADDKTIRVITRPFVFSPPNRPGDARAR